MADSVVPGCIQDRVFTTTYFAGLLPHVITSRLCVWLHAGERCILVLEKECLSADIDHFPVGPVRSWCTTVVILVVEMKGFPKVLPVSSVGLIESAGWVFASNGGFCRRNFCCDCACNRLNVFFVVILLVVIYMSTLGRIGSL